VSCHFTIQKPVTFDNGTHSKEIIVWMQNAIDHNDNFTKISRIRGRRTSEGLTRLLWRCPICRTLEGLSEKKGGILSCKKCGREWDVNLHFFMREIGTDTWKPVKEYADLMFREEEIVPTDNGFGDHLEDKEHVFLVSGENTVHIYFKYKKYRKIEKTIETGRLLLTNFGFIFIKKSDSGCIRYPLENIRSCFIVNNSILHIEYWLNPWAGEDGGDLHPHHEWFEMKDESCLKWQLYYDFLHYDFICKKRSLSGGSSKL
jgi:hypothetical protein